MHILTPTGYQSLGHLLNPALNNPKVSRELIKLVRDKVSALNTSTGKYNQAVDAAKAQGRVLGWFPDMTDDDGKVTTWGPKPADVPHEPLYVLPEWAAYKTPTTA